MSALAISNFPQMSFACGEAVNMLCTNLSFSGENVKRVMITSCHASEGKSYLSMNLLRTMAKLGRRVVMVDCDLRRSNIVEHYGITFPDMEEPPGLSHLLAGLAEEADVIYETDMPGAYMVPVGRNVSNSLSLLNSSRFQTLMETLRREFDYAIIDAPPIGLVIDAAQIAKYCDGTLLVIGYNTVRRQEILDAKAQIDQTSCPILGAVINRTEYDSFLSRKYAYKSYYSQYGYSQKKGDKKDADLWRNPR
ncbi:MAG: CpsD/CapB family tyrosine-protein kinase [Clostridia bacterium]|nr:CpsD/CapB family tyrosine-protein kinase [Clostridia bacterium]